MSKCPWTHFRVTFKNSNTFLFHKKIANCIDRCKLAFINCFFLFVIMKEIIFW